MANTKITASLLDPAQTSITSLGTLSALTISGDLTVDTSTLKVDSSNNRVGIGTATPQWPLQIDSDDDLTDFTSTANGAMMLRNTDYNTGDYTALDFGYSSYTHPIGRIGLKITGSGSYLAFGTSNSYSSGVTNEAMTIDYNGKVGIGTTSPGVELDVNGDIRLLGTGTDNDSHILYFNNGAAAIARDNNDLELHAYNAMVFGVSNTSYPTSTERMRIDSGGRVSFGPDALDIQIDPASTNSGNNILYMRGNASNDKSEIQLNHYGHADYHIGVGHVANGTFNISNSQTGSDFVINSSGKVGIQETSPDYNLHISNSSQVGLKVEGSGSGYVQGSILLSSAPSGSNAYRGHGIFYWNNESQTEWFLGAPYTDSDRFVINRKASQSTADFSSAYIHASHGQNFLTIENNGYVGIGTTTLNKFFNLADPNNGGEENKLHFEASGVTHWSIYPYDRVNSHYPSLYLGTNANLKVLNTGAVQIGNASDGVLVHAHPPDGRVGIGTTQPGGKFMIEANGQNIDLFVLNNTRSGSNSTAIQQFKREGTNTGYIANTSSSTSYNTSQSDRRAKKNFEDWTENVLPYFKDLKPTKFHFTQEDDSSEKNKGYIAQDLVDSFPEAYPVKDTGEDAGRYFFNPSGMVVYLMKAVQELSAEVESLKEKLNG